MLHNVCIKGKTDKQNIYYAVGYCTPNVIFDIYTLLMRNLYVFVLLPAYLHVFLQVLLTCQ